MKISQITQNIIKEAKEIAQSTKEKYKEKVAPKVNEFVDESIDYVNKNYPKAKEKINNIYTKVKKEVNETVNDYREIYKQLTLPTPKAIKLKNQVSIIKQKYTIQAIKIQQLKKYEQQNQLKIQKEIQILNKLKTELELAEQKYQTFIKKQNAVQKEFDRINQVNK